MGTSRVGEVRDHETDTGIVFRRQSIALEDQTTREG